MGPVNWLAVIAAAALALAVSELWHRGLSGRGSTVRGALPAVFALLLVSAAMLGHMFARVGAATLGAKPWLFAMMAGGLALAFVVPALWIGSLRERRPRRDALLDGGHWLTVYLAMGAAFWAFG